MAIKGVQLGMLNKRISLYRSTVTTNEGFGKDVNYNEAGSVWAYVKKKSGYRNQEAGIDGLEEQKDFYVRFSTFTGSITKDWLIKYDEKKYIIGDIQKISEGQMMIKITATERESWVTTSSS